MNPEFHYRELQFPNLAVLTSAMLEELYAYPRDLLRLQYQGFSDGILFGLNYEERQNEIWLTAGTLLWQGAFYFLHQDLNLSQLKQEANLLNDGIYQFQLRKVAATKEEVCITQHKLQLSITVEETQIADCFPLGTFPTAALASLRFPNTLNEFKTLRNFFDLLAVPYAALKEATFHPQVFRVVKSYLEQKERRTVFDYALLIHLQSHGILPMETMRCYIKEVEVIEEPMNRQKLFITFLECLQKPAPCVVAVQEKATAPIKKKTRSEGKRLL